MSRKNKFLAFSPDTDGAVPDAADQAPLLMEWMPAAKLMINAGQAEDPNAAVTRNFSDA